MTIMTAKIKPKGDNKYLRDIFTLNHRYTRSVSLERDLESVECLRDYVVTERAAYTLSRIISGMSDGSSHSWVLTGVYGTGKSAFAHFLASLLAPPESPLHKTARNILSLSGNRQLLPKDYDSDLKEGVLFAVATGQYESIYHTLLRAIHRALNSYEGGRKKSKNALLAQTNEITQDLDNGEEIDSLRIIRLIEGVSAISQSGLFILIDEMGKPLEYTVQNQRTGDLFILQQICELPQHRSSTYFLGLLHHSFSEHGYNLGSLERNEWLKVQGRFEEIPFTESAAQMIQLLGEVIRRNSCSRLEEGLGNLTENWFRELPNTCSETRLVSPDILLRLIPLHPITVLVLPQLFVRYAQNDRSLFSFLTSNEPNSLKAFIEESRLDQNDVPLFKLAKLYDYFTETSLSNLVLKPNFQRWVEIKQLIDEHSSEANDVLCLLKTIGILNLANTTGSLRATRSLVALALCDSPTDKSEVSKWDKLIDVLLHRGVITYRRQIDELRLWEGSDFDFDRAISKSRERLQSSLAILLEESHPLRAAVAQKHSYQTGAMRYFESRYFDRREQLNELSCCTGSSGLVGYWVSEDPLNEAPATTLEGKPFVLVQAGQVASLRQNAFEYTALRHVLENSNELKSDGVARREIRHRLVQARFLLDESLTKSLKHGSQLKTWIMGRPVSLDLKKGLNAELSKLCDEVYENHIVLWNELINRQELTSQGAKARKQVIAAMLENSERQNLGLSGNGPEVSVYQSVLKRTGIHSMGDGGYKFDRPVDPRFGKVWEEIENYCFNATDQSRKLDHVFETLQRPPFGIKSGVIPILFAAVVISHSDDVGIYKDDFFIPQLGPEHFELLVKDPSRFSVKHYKVAGVRGEVFREVENILIRTVGLPRNVRNRTILGVVSPFLKFARGLPYYSKNTERLSKRAQEVRRLLLNAPDPDELIFSQLPQACGLPPFTTECEAGDGLPERFRNELASALKEIRESYELLLGNCRAYLHEAFGVKQDASRLREDLRSRASYLQGRSIEPILSRFILVATDGDSDDTDWLQSLLMTIADKPVDSWTDSDVDMFEFKLSDIARRFNHLEAIHKSNTRLWNGAAEARRVSVIKTDGTELHNIAWIEEKERPIIEKAVDEILERVLYDKTQQRAALAILAEKILGRDVTPKFKNINSEEEVENATCARPIRRKG